MSWMKRRTPAATPSPGLQTTPSPVQMYNPNQHSNSAQEWQQQQPTNWYDQPTMQSVSTMPTVNEQNSQVLQPNAYWQQLHYQPPQQQQQQQPQQYQYGGNAEQNNYFQQQVQQPGQQQIQQAYEYNNMQYGYQRSAHGFSQQPMTSNAGQYNQITQPQQQQQSGDGWSNAWGWGDEDNSNVNNVHNANTVANPKVQADLVADSFNDESWNWNVEDNLPAVGNALPPMESKYEPASNASSLEHKPPEELFPKVGSKALKPENLETVPLLPPTAVNRRIKSEALTPQWSIESQVSQESSDDILQTSESDKLFSRSSTISHSPVSGHQTPQEPPSAAKAEPFEAENRENVRDEVDVKPSQMVPPPVGGGGADNPFKRVNSAGARHRTPPPPTVAMAGDARGFYVPPTSMHQSVNLETVPDNSEAPDLHLQHAASAGAGEGASAAEVTPPPAASTPLENNEVAPLNERNQYLETGQLSDENDALPPPGLSRMVLGQLEASEPPPGLSRMVLGQTEGAHSTASPPVGLHRMVPGESSSPEVRFDEEEASDPELRQMGRNPLQSRSATIGADTPPAPPINGAEQVEREMNLDGANTQDSTGNDVDTLASAVRDLTVGGNTSDGRQATDSDAECASLPHERKERRHREDAGRRDKRYSPDYGRDGRDNRGEKARHQRRQHDRGFDDGADYFSDRERDRRRDEHERTRVDDADKKYGSLRRGGERDKDRRRRDARDARDDRDRRSEYARRERERDYYYNNHRYNDDYDDAHRSSRPSSRSDSMHDAYYRDARGGSERDRRRDRERDRERDARRHRDPYGVYKMPGYHPYDAYNPYYQQYQYYVENLRRTDPAAYAELYRKYYGQSAATSSTYTQEEKTSVHSGRSSTNDDLAKERYLRQGYYGHASYSQMSAYYREPQSLSCAQYGLDESRPYDYADSALLLEDSAVPQRFTPAKFSTAHIKSSIASGRLVRILPNYPMDGQPALVEVERLHELLHADDELDELEHFPGPLMRGVTHKKTIIEYCNNKIRDRATRKDIDDPESYVLMWELLILLIRQNGMVVGADIAELLMKGRNAESIMSRPSSVASNSSGAVEMSEGSNVGDAAAGSAAGSSAVKEEHVTRKFREYLLYGSVQQALEWAMKHSLWGHALFLASKLDKRTYAKVMTRFANGLPMNDPLQTLYQLLSGHLPAAVTSVSDEKWGDWRPHLAMILSNTMQRPELDRKAITTLGDTLMGRGNLYAAQFCYLMAEVGFSRYGQEGKLVLLGADHAKPFRQFAHNEAIHMTEIYEYACSLNNASFKIPEFQAYKYLLATRLADRGFLEATLAYVEQVSVALVASPALAQPSLINKVCDLADRLKYYDPADYQHDDDAQLQPGDGRPDQSWLQGLKAVQQQYAMGMISHESVNNLRAMTPEATAPALQAPPSYDHSPQDPWHVQNQYNQSAGGSWQQQQSVEADYNQQQPPPPPPPLLQPDATTLDSYNAYQDQPWSAQPAQVQPQWSAGPLQSPLEPTPDPGDLSAHQQQAVNDYWSNAQVEEQQPRPHISMPNQSRQPRTSLSEDAGGLDGDPPRKAGKEAEKKTTNASASAGWFGGIWSKLALRPKNQMKLPDDKNPTIVWDQDKKRWINREEDNANGAGELKPPPRMPPSSVAAPVQQPQSLPNLNAYGGMSAPGSQPQSVDAHPQSDAKPPLPSQNMFKMQRGRNLKKSYVDVFNPSGKAPSPGASADFAAPAMFAASAAPVNFFVPAPMDPNAPVDFLTPSTVPLQDPNMQSHQS